MRKKTAIAAAAAWLCIAAAGPSAGALPAAEKNLVVLFTHDLHSSFRPHGLLTFEGRTVERGGWAKLAALLAAERAAAPGRVLTVDGGDFSMGTLFHALFVREASELRLLGRMGFDAATLGNHEFDFSLAGLASGLRAAKAKGGPVPALVASNIVLGAGVAAEDARAFADYPVRDYLVLERGGLRVGLFGLMGQGAYDDSPFIAPAAVPSALDQAKRVVAVLRDREKVDLVVALSHCGTEGDLAASEDVRLAESVPGIDVIVSGHSHTLLPQPVVRGRTLIVSAGHDSEYLGRLEIAWSPQGGARLLSYAVRPITPDLPDDPEILTEIAGFKAVIERDVLAPLGFGMDQVLAESGLIMATSDEMESRDAETGLGDLITESFREAVRKAEGPAYTPIALSVEPSGSIRGTLLPGPLTVDAAFRLLSLGWDETQTPGYPLVALYLNGREIRRLIEISPSIGPRKAGAYLQFSGVRFTSNPHRLLFERAYGVSIVQPDGAYAPLESDRLYRVCTNYYTGLMVDYISRASYGILKMQAKDRTGRVLTDLKEAIVDGDPARPGVQPIKEWMALAEALKTFPDTDGNGIPDIPKRFDKPEGRYASVPSWNPAALLAGAGLLTYGALALAVLVMALAALIVRRIRRRRNSKRR